MLITSSTILKQNDAHVGLDAFAVGNKVEARYDATRMQALKLEAGNNLDNHADSGQAEGTISTVTADSLSITLHSGQVVTVLINSGTTLERNDAHVTLSALQLGDRVEALFDATTMIAMKVEAVGM